MYDDFYKLSEQEQYEYEREYNEYLDRLDAERTEDDLPDEADFEHIDENSEEEDLFESYDESYVDEDETVYGYDDLLDREEEYRELDFN